MPAGSKKNTYLLLAPFLHLPCFLLAFNLHHLYLRVTMKRENVNSSVLKSVGYDKKNRTLETELLNNTLYEYYQVDYEEYKNLIEASSLGKYYNQVIKKHPCNKLK